MKSRPGLGVDLVEIARIRTSITKHGDRFLHRIFTEEELAYCMERPDPAIHLAVRFAAKEAVSKALGTGIGKHLGWKDIEITRLPSGQPLITLSPKAKALHGDPDLLLSLAHTETTAVASVLRI